MNKKLNLILFFPLFFYYSTIVYSSNNQDQREAKKCIRAKYCYFMNQYRITLLCEKLETCNKSTNIDFSINIPIERVQNIYEKIGDISLEYYPLSKPQYFHTSPAHTIRLKHIEINEAFRQQKYATEALSLLFYVLNHRPLWPRERTQIWLECNLKGTTSLEFTSAHLKRFFEKFGFTATEEKRGLGDIIVMGTGLLDITYPLSRKSQINWISLKTHTSKTLTASVLQTGDS